MIKGAGKTRKAKVAELPPHKFKDKLLLNQWMLSLFGIDPLKGHTLHGTKARAFHILTDSIKDPRLEGLDNDNLHHFYHHLGGCPLLYFGQPLLETPGFTISRAELLNYEENIVRQTLAINSKRHRPIIWKYYQWLTLLFTEIYLDRWFRDRDALLNGLNVFVERFNRHWKGFKDVPPYCEDDLNKVCLQNATGSGKTYLMHVNLLQYRHYAKLNGRANDLSRVILLTPNDRLSEQHISEFGESAIAASSYQNNLFSQAQGLNAVDILEITKLAEKDSVQQIATRSLGDQNLLLVDEGHRGISGKDAKKNENAWFKNRAMLCEKGFTFEYSATFDQAVSGTGHEDDYAKAVLFDYSYRWFYEDGFGKDYQILNLPATYSQVQFAYLTACLLKYYQQLRIYQEKLVDFAPFNLEKPLWVFVGSTVGSIRATKTVKDKKIEVIDETASDVGQIIRFIAAFLEDRAGSTRIINNLLTGSGSGLGLLDAAGNDIFAGAFSYLAGIMNKGEKIDDLYRDILARLFNNSGGGTLCIERVKGDSGELALKVGDSGDWFGLINVGDAKGLADHLETLGIANVSVREGDSTEAMFASVKDSSSPVNLLVGSKKFVEGWDCWRVSTMGLMHVGKSEGAQIIQLFGRGVRLKGYDWSLKRSGHTGAPSTPNFIEEIETLNVFGIEADFMEKFRQYLADEGLPGNERKTTITIPLNVTFDFGKKLKMLRPKRKKEGGGEYDFKKDAPVPSLGIVPQYLTQNPVVADWYPRIQSIASEKAAVGGEGHKQSGALSTQTVELLDYDMLFFELEQFKRERSWFNFNISKVGIKTLLERNDWYTLYLPEVRRTPTNYDGVMLLQQVATELLKRYCEHCYNYKKREFIEPRLELRELTAADDNLPREDFYQLIVDGDEAALIQGINQLKAEIEAGKGDLIKIGSEVSACLFGTHLFQPLFQVRRGGKITVLPVSLNESEFQFVCDLKTWCDATKEDLAKRGIELFLLRNLSRGKGIGFFEAGNFHPDFILWMLVDGKQYVTFIEPHGLLHEGIGSEKVQFHTCIKEVEKRLNDQSVILNSFILSWTRFPQLNWGIDQQGLEEKHVLFMTDDRDKYIGKLFSRLKMV